MGRVSKEITEAMIELMRIERGTPLTRSGKSVYKKPDEGPIVGYAPSLLVGSYLRTGRVRSWLRVKALSHDLDTT